MDEATKPREETPEHNNVELQELEETSGEAPAQEEADEDLPRPTAEQLTLLRYEKMLQRAGFVPTKYLGHLVRIQKNEGADAMKLGVVSGQQYKEIFTSRAFDEFFFQIPPEKSTLEMMSEVARKILSKDPSADDQQRKEEEEAKLAAGHYGGVSKPNDSKKNEARLHRIGFKETVFGPPGLAPPQKNILNSEGREKYFSYDGDWVEGNMHGYGKYRFADGMTYEGIMRDNWQCGEGKAIYPNGGVYVGRWKDGMYEGYGVLTYSSGSVYEGNWHEGQRSGKGRLRFKSGSEYTGDFRMGLYHGRGRFVSANLKVVYEGWWKSGFVCGHGSLTMPDGTKCVRAWPEQSRFGGGLSLRGAMEIIQYEKEQARLDKLDQKQALYGVAELAELQFRVQSIRREIAERKAVTKAEDKAEMAAKRKAAKLAMMEAKLNALLEEEKAAEPDDLEKQLMM